MRDGEDDIDRRAILARRAAFVSAALAAMSCAKGEPPPQPPPDPAPPVRPVEVDPGGTLEPPPVDASVPPLDVPPGIDEADRVALEQFASWVRPLYEQLAALKAELPDCVLPEPACEGSVGDYLERLNRLGQDIHFMHPLCGFSEDARTVVVLRTNTHARHLADEVERIRERLRDAQAAHGKEAAEALRVLGTQHAVAVPCLSCVAQTGLVLAGRTIGFAHDSTTPIDTAMISRLATQISAFPGTHIEVRGHADPSETQPDALALSRAQAVVAALVAAGVPPRRLTALGFGTRLRVDAFDTEEVRAANRRVDFEMQ